MLGQIQFTWDFLLAFLSIIVIDLILAGDNAVVIALAVRSLPIKQRMRGIVLGAGGAVLLRVAFTYFAAYILQIQCIKFIGGILIIWIAIKLFSDEAPDDKLQKDVKTIWQAVWIIVIADITMSTDNVLAVAAASKGNIFLLIFGLGLSIPLVVFTSTLLSMLMDKYPVIIYVGSAILGKVGGEMIMTDPFITQIFNPSITAQYAVEVFLMIGVIFVGKLLIKLKASRQIQQDVRLQDEPPNIP